MMNKKSVPAFTLIRPGLWTKRNNIPAIKKLLRAKVPKLSIYDVQKKRSCFYVAIINETKDKGFTQSAQFMEQLINLEKEILKSNIQYEARLTADQHLLERISSKLKLSEAALFQNFKPRKSIGLILELADNISKTSSDFWIAEQIYLIALKMSQETINDRGETECKVCYLYGHFLTRKAELHNIAIEYLKKANGMSIGTYWAIKDESSYLLISRQTNILLSRCSFKQSIMLNNSNISQAVEYSLLGLEYALSSDDGPTICEAYQECAFLSIKDDNYNKALDYLTNAIKYSRDSSLHESTCDCILLKAECLIKINEIARAESFIRMSLECSQKHDLQLHSAKAYLLFGEIAITNNKMGVARSHFVRAVQICSSSEIIQDFCMRSRYLAAYSLASHIFKPYVQLVKLATVSSNKEKYLNKLKLWREKEKSFWTEDDHGNALLNDD